ncbi:MAG: alpha/beta hydrolase [Bacteroidia bacterium]
MKTEVYIFSGLGADERIFQNLDFSTNNVTHIKWIEPSKNELIEDYAFRITKQINEKNPILLGVSFGGIIATEVAKHISCSKIVIISSVKTRWEVPFYFRWAVALKLHLLIPTNFLKHANFISYWLFGVKNQNEKDLLKNILADTNDIFLKWALGKIGKWKNIIIHSNLIHIHGDNDRILPISFSKPNYQIKGGGHFMTLNNASEITEILKKEINN